MKHFFYRTSKFMLHATLGFALLAMGVTKCLYPNGYYSENFLFNTTLLSWMGRYITHHFFICLVGIIQLLAGFMLLAGFLVKKMTKWGALLAMILLIGSFPLFFASGIIWATGNWVPHVAAVGHFFIRDMVLFSVALWCLAESY